MLEAWKQKEIVPYQIKEDYFAQTNREEPILSILLPAYNEANVIQGVVRDYYNEIVTKLPSKLVVAEDGSDDQTPQLLASLGNEIPISLFSDRNRKGYSKGVSDALKRCDEEWVFFSDSDKQYFPSDFWRLWENRYGYDMVIGHKVHRNEAIHRIVLSKFFHGLINLLFGLNLKDGDCGFRLIKKDVIRSVTDETRVLKYSFWTEFTVRSYLKGFRVLEVPINHASRKNGDTRIYLPSRIPLIILKQLAGLAALFASTKKKS